LVRGLREIREELDYPIKGFSDLSAKEISRLTGLDSKSVPSAVSREFDEPFILPEHENLDINAVRRAAEKRGFQITKGGRFYHIHGKNDKGTAVKKLIEWYKESYPNIFSIGLGDSSNDFSMLKVVDQPVLILSGQHFPGIEEEITGLMITHRPGPEGWNSAILDILSQRIEGGFS
jgi:mannosyl-3-phosphoglycerate phosphatase family protein